MTESSIPLYSAVQKGIRNPQKIPPFILGKISKPVVGDILLPLSVLAGHRLNIGQNIFDYDWDVLIVLDGCRSDALKEVESEYSFINNPSEIWSVGGRTIEWLTNTFKKEHKQLINHTAYITSAPTAITVFEELLKQNHHQENITKPANKRVEMYGNKSFVSSDDFGDFQGFYKMDINATNGTCVGMKRSCQAITNYGINLIKNRDFERIVLHYMPPHPPYFATKSSKGEMAKISKRYENINIRSKPIDVNRRNWNAYIDNLRWGLDEISILLHELRDERVVITSDHGRSFINYGRSDAESGSVNPRVRKVPWVVTGPLN